MGEGTKTKSINFIRAWLSIKKGGKMIIMANLT
jgi:hypothetical protein